MDIPKVDFSTTFSHSRQLSGEIECTAATESITVRAENGGDNAAGVNGTNCDTRKAMSISEAATSSPPPAPAPVPHQIHKLALTGSCVLNFIILKLLRVSRPLRKRTGGQGSGNWHKEEEWKEHSGGKIGRITGISGGHRQDAYECTVKKMLITAVNQWNWLK